MDLAEVGVRVGSELGASGQGLQTSKSFGICTPGLPYAVIQAASCQRQPPLTSDIVEYVYYDIFFLGGGVRAALLIPIKVLGGPEWHTGFLTS